MPKDIVKLCEEGERPRLQVEQGRVSEQSKKDADSIFLSLGGHVFFASAQPMKSRSVMPRRGWSEFVSELVAFAKRVHDLAMLWQSGDNVVERAPVEIRKILGSAAEASG